MTDYTINNNKSFLKQSGIQKYLQHETRVFTQHPCFINIQCENIHKTHDNEKTLIPNGIATSKNNAAKGQFCFCQKGLLQLTTRLNGQSDNNHSHDQRTQHLGSLISAGKKKSSRY